MDFDAGNTSDPATAQACGSDTLEGSRDNNEPMQAGILGANDKSEEAVPTDGQFQSPPSNGEGELQGATAAIVRSHLHDEDKGTLSFNASGSEGSSAANIPLFESAVTSLTSDAEMPPLAPSEAIATAAEESVSPLVQRVAKNSVAQRSLREELEQLRRRVEWREQWIREDRERRQGRESEMQEGDVQPLQQQLAVPACSQQQVKYRKELLDPAIAECCTLHKIHKECKDKLVQHGEMDSNAGNTTDPATSQARGSEDNNEPMQAGILGANDKSEEAVPTDGQTQSPPSDGEDELQEATAAVDASGSAEESASAVERGINEASFCRSEDNNEPMQAGILGANDKSEEAVPTDGQTQSPPSDGEDELQEATAAVDASGSAEESASAVKRGINEAFFGGSEDNNEPMQAGILGANDKSEEAVPTDGQTQSPPSDGEDELQEATAAVDASGSAEESASAVERGINEASFCRSEDNNEPMQAGILSANDKSEEAVPTDGQFQSPPSDREDELQGATAAVDASGSAEESASAVEQRINEAFFCASLDQVHHELELIRRSVVQGQQRRRESEMQECEVEPQQQQLALPACPQQVGPSQHCEICNICIDQHAQENHHCLPDECCVCWELLDPVFAECCTLPCLHKIHKECKDQLVQHGRSNCPLCRGPLSPPRE